MISISTFIGEDASRVMSRIKSMCMALHSVLVEDKDDMILLWN